MSDDTQQQPEDVSIPGENPHLASMLGAFAAHLAQQLHQPQPPAPAAE